MKKTKTTYVKLKPVDRQSEKAFGIDGLIVEESIDQTKGIRFFVPKGLTRDDTAPPWFSDHRARETRRAADGCHV